MTLVLAPIPPEAVEQAYPVLAPFLEAIAQRSGNDRRVMDAMLYQGEAQAFLIWDPEKKRAQAFLGVAYERNARGLIGKLIWLTGEDRKAWLHLFAELETYLRDHQKCIKIVSIARPGWAKVLKVNGYRLTHQVMEKEFAS